MHSWTDYMEAKVINYLAIEKWFLMLKVYVNNKMPIQSIRYMAKGTLIGALEWKKGYFTSHNYVDF